MSFNVPAQKTNTPEPVISTLSLADTRSLRRLAATAFGLVCLIPLFGLLITVALAIRWVCDFNRRHKFRRLRWRNRQIKVEHHDAFVQCHPCFHFERIRIRAVSLSSAINLMQFIGYTTIGVAISLSLPSEPTLTLWKASFVSLAGLHIFYIRSFLSWLDTQQQRQASLPQKRST